MIAFRRVVIVMLENASRDTVLTNQYMRDLRKKGVFLSNNHCITHPSQPNYFTLTAGDTMGVASDSDGWAQYTTVLDKPEAIVSCIADAIDEKGIGWKAYAECLPDLQKYPYPAMVPDAFPFVRRHVPFLSFKHIMQNMNYATEHIVDAAAFDTDLANGTLPHYSFYTPNLINDGHSMPKSPVGGPKNNCNAEDGGSASPTQDGLQLDNIEAFLKSFLGDDPVGKFPPETLIVITFDESYGADVPYNIYTLLIGDMLSAGTVCQEPYNHYSLLRTIEDNFGLRSLGRNDAAARPYWFVR